MIIQITNIDDLEITNDSGFVEKVTENQDKARVFFHYFSSVFNKDLGQNDSFKFNKCTNEKVIINITEENIIKRLNNLNVYKSAGPDMIHPRVLKEVREVIGFSLKICLNVPLQQKYYQQNGNQQLLLQSIKKGKKVRQIIIDQ